MNYHRRSFRVTITLGVVLLLGACRDLTPPLPAGISDPAALQTEEGALSLYRGALRAAGVGVREFVFGGSAMTDEVRELDVGNPLYAGRIPMTMDARTMVETDDAATAYQTLHKVRSNTAQAIAWLNAYAPASPPALRGELYAWQGYAEIMLAELYCSGIPLSTVDFDGDYTYKKGSTKNEVFTHALAFFDSALAMSGDSTRIMHFARVGKGRALLNLGQFAEAAAAVMEVPEGYTYALPVALAPNETFAAYVFAGLSVSDREGGNGLPFRSSGDVRSTVRSNGKMPFVNDSVWIPEKYESPGAALTIVIASAIEARLIEAEAALRDNRLTEWAQQLNILRASAISPSIPALSPDSVTTVSGPAADTMRTDVLFHERAFWLFLTGHRQGDMRRLIRQYGRNPQDVYPTGFMDPSGFSSYGSAVVRPVPGAEQSLNPLYTGCFDRGA